MMPAFVTISFLGSNQQRQRQRQRSFMDSPMATSEPGICSKWKWNGTRCRGLQERHGLKPVDFAIVAKLSPAVVSPTKACVVGLGNTDMFPSTKALYRGGH